MTKSAPKRGKELGPMVQRATEENRALEQRGGRDEGKRVEFFRFTPHDDDLIHEQAHGIPITT